MVVNFAKRMKIALFNTYFQKREEHSLLIKWRQEHTGGFCFVFVIQSERLETVKVMTGESVARQHQMVVCRKLGGVWCVTWTGRMRKRVGGIIQESIQRMRLTKKKWDGERM